MHIHKEGYSTLIIVGLVCSLIIFLALRSASTTALVFGGLALFFFLFILQFFRVPQRKTPPEPQTFVSPADGKVVVIERVFEEEYFKDERLQVSIFMSPFDVHLNRVPLDGQLIYYKYHPGKFLVAWEPKSSELNERNTIVIETPEYGSILLRQIAGAVARRIRFFHHVGDVLNKGDELGFIKFGSRMDIFLPLDTELKVELGQQLYAGESIIAASAPKPD